MDFFPEDLSKNLALYPTHQNHFLNIFGDMISYLSSASYMTYLLIVISQVSQNYYCGIMAEYSIKQHYYGDMHFRVDGDQLMKILPRSVGALTYLNAKQEKMFGTGVLISKDLILTAAHNIYDKLENKQFSSFRFYIGANGSIKKYYGIEAWMYPAEFKICPLYSMLQFDYAILKLKDEIIYEQYLPLSMLCQICKAENECKRFSIVGFPCIQQNIQILNEQDSKIRLYQYGDIGKLSLIEAANFKVGYKISSLLGQNGCPVVDDESIVAINLGGDLKRQYNIGRIIDAPLIDNLVKWRKYLNGTQFSIVENRACAHVRHAFKTISNPQTRICLAGLQDKYLDLEYPNLLKMELLQNLVQQIDISKCTQLTQAYFFDSKLYTIDVRHNLNLNSLQLCINNLEKIDVSLNTRLKYLNLGYNNVASIDLSRNTKLENLSMYSTKISSIDLSHNSELTVLSLINQGIEHIDLSNNKKLVRLNLTHNKIAAIDLTNNQSLEEVFINNNLLTEVDIRSNKKIASIGVAFNKITKMQIYIPRDLPFHHFTTTKEEEAYYSFSSQDSSNCKIELSYQGEDVKEKVQKIMEIWTQRYLKLRQNLYNCAYSFDFS